MDSSTGWYSYGIKKVAKNEREIFLLEIPVPAAGLSPLSLSVFINRRAPETGVNILEFHSRIDISSRVVQRNGDPGHSPLERSH